MERGPAPGGRGSRGEKAARWAGPGSSGGAAGLRRAEAPPGESGQLPAGDGAQARRAAELARGEAAAAGAERRGRWERDHVGRGRGAGSRAAPGAPEGRGWGAQLLLCRLLKQAGRWRSLSPPPCGRWYAPARRRGRGVRPALSPRAGAGWYVRSGAAGGAPSSSPPPSARGGRRLLRGERAALAGRHGGGGSSGRERGPACSAPLRSPLPAAEPWWRAGSLRLLG